MNSSQVQITKIVTLLLAFSGSLIYFAWDANFNMQVLFPIMFLVIFWYFIKTNFYIVPNEDIKTAICIIGVYMIAFVTNVILNIEIISFKSVIRLFYSAIIVFYFAIVVNLKYTFKDVLVVLSGNLICSVFASVLIIKNWLAGAMGKISLISFFGESIEENYTGAFLAFGFSIGIYLLLNVKKSLLKTILILISEVSIIFSIFLTGSRAALIATVLSVALYSAIYIFSKDSKLYKKILFVCVIIFSLFYILANAEKILPDFLYNRMFGGLQTLNDKSNSERVELWKFALSNYYKRPLFGYGAGNFTYYVHQVFPNHEVVVAHNTFIDLLIDSGAIGFTLYMILFFRNIKKAFVSEGKMVFPLVVCFMFTSIILGAERTFFVWNDLFIMSIMCKYIYDNDSRGEKI